MNCHATNRQWLKTLGCLGLVALNGALWHPVQAQESLAGLGAASAAGAGLGAAAAGGMTAATNRARGAANGAGGLGEPGQDPDFPAGAPNAPGAPGGGVSAAPASNAPPAQTFGITSRELVGQLMARPPATRMPQPETPRRSPSGQANYARRVARMSPQARKRAVLQKYKIPPVDWRRAYLPQDRYKFAKAWQFVSTEDSIFYFTPQALARRRFNPNRVIGFRTWQDAMLAGYRPDPATRPTPGVQIAALASMTRGEGLYQYVDYVYGGQVTPDSLAATYNYALQVRNALNRSKDGRRYISPTVNKVLLAAVTGDSSLIPSVIVIDDGIVRTRRVPAANPGIPPSPGAPPAFGSASAPPSAPPGGGLKISADSASPTASR